MIDTRYSESQTEETWVTPAPNQDTRGFPYTFPIIFDRENERYSFAEEETWVNDVS